MEFRREIRKENLHMKLDPIITSLLELDAYKLNMGNVIANQFSNDHTRWAFKCRNEDVKFTPEMIQEIRDQVDHFCSLSFTDDELTWLKKNFPWLKEGYINNVLRFWHPVRKEIFVNEGNIQAYNNCGLVIEAEGTWLNTSMYEIPILAIVNEVYFAFKYGVGAKDIVFQTNTIEKFTKLITGEYDIGTFSEFGMRRRYSAVMQDWLVKYITDRKVPGFVGTSNVFLAKKYGVKAVGTQAHEFFMAQQGHFDINPAYSNKFALAAWRKEYETQLGIALTDTIGTEVFLRDFGLTDANSFSGVRHDSGDPFEWGDTMIRHYEKLGIDPKMKTLLFSDSLNFKKASELKKYFEGRTKVAFGIGTYLANDLDVPALNIVFKMVECNGAPVAKLSNTPSKGMCKDPAYVEYLKRAIDWRLKYQK